MISIQTFGFLSTMLYLKPLQPALFSEFREGNDQHLTNASEAVIIPNRDFLKREKDSLENNLFHGVESLKGTSLAIIQESEGRNLLEYYLQSPYFLNEGMSTGETLQYAVNLSGMLHQIRQESSIVRLHQTEEGHVVYPFHQGPPDLKSASSAVHY